MKKLKGETWHLYKILDCLEKQQTQSDIVKASKVNNFTLKDYLKKLQTLDFIEKVDRNSALEKRNGRAIIWQATTKGKIFKKVISQYVSLVCEL